MLCKSNAGSDALQSNSHRQLGLSVLSRKLSIPSDAAGSPAQFLLSLLRHLLGSQSELRFDRGGYAEYSSPSAGLIVPAAIRSCHRGWRRSCTA